MEFYYFEFFLVVEIYISLENNLNKLIILNVRRLQKGF